MRSRMYSSPRGIGYMINGNYYQYMDMEVQFRNRECNKELDSVVQVEMREGSNEG